MSKQIDLQGFVTDQAEGLDAHKAAEMARFDALTAEVGELRQQADRLAGEAQTILTENLTVRETWERRR